MTNQDHEQSSTSFNFLKKKNENKQNNTETKTKNTKKSVPEKKPPGVEHEEQRWRHLRLPPPNFRRGDRNPNLQHL